LIDEAIVNQKPQGILVTFPDRDITIQPEGRIKIPYKGIGNDAILFSPGNFRGLKVFTLSHPSRLVIDVYLEKTGQRVKAELLRLKTVIIDPGHGGYESGLIREEYKEKNVVLDIAKKLGALIRRGNTKAMLTRESDLFLPLNERIKFTNVKGADVFISLHIGNHSEVVLYIPVITDSVPDYIRQYLINRGQEEYLDKTAILVRALKEAIASDFGEDMVVVRPLPYSILSKIEAAAVMIELPSFEDAYYIEELKSQMAYTIYKGLYIYEENSAG